MKINTQTLRKALNTIRPIIERRTTLPILSCVKLHTERNRLHIAATNLDEYIVERVECEGGFEPVCVSFNHLSLAISGEETAIKQNKGSILVKCGQDETEISTLAGDEFPPLPKFDKAQTHGVACEELANALNLVSWAASTDDAPYVLKSALIESDAKKLTVFATNRREMAFVETALIGSKFSILVPSDFSNNLSGALLRKGATLSSNENQIRASHDSGNYFCKQIEGNYPNWRQVIPVASKPLGSVKVSDIKNMVSGCVGFDNKTEARGTLRFSNGGMIVEFLGEGGSKLTRHYAGQFKAFTIALSLRKMLLIFSSIKTETASLLYVDESSPLRIESGDLTVLTMPHRLT